jgi:glycosyltransferase involved in cell wall biosynthesis
MRQPEGRATFDLRRVNALMSGADAGIRYIYRSICVMKYRRALFLSPQAPYPAIGGGPLRSASLLEYLARSFSVHAIVFREPGDPDLSLAMPSGLVDKLDVIDLPYHSKQPFARALRNMSRIVRNRPPLLDRFSGFEEAIAARVASQHYDFAILEHFWCAPYVSQLRLSSKNVLLDLHNVESVWHRSLAASESPGRAFALRRFATASVALERKWLPKFDRLLVTSRTDLERVQGIVPDSSITVYPNALPYVVAPPREEKDEIVFSGNLEYAPNISAVRFFNERVWPMLRTRWPKLRWKIIGRSPEAIRSLIADDARIELTGFVENALTALAQSQVAIVPMLAGSGTRVKILEAWAAGTAVVSTTLGAEGLQCRDGEHCLLADTPPDFAEAVSRLLESPADRARIGSAGRLLFEQNYTWKAAWTRLDSIFGTTVADSVL